MSNRLKEKWLKREGTENDPGYQDLTKQWYRIKETPASEMSESDRRKAYDKLYNTATFIVFGDEIGATDGKSAALDSIEKYMREGGWLKVGFEAGDGNDKRMKLAMDLVGRASNSPAAGSIVKTTLERYDYIDDYLVNNEPFTEEFKNVITDRVDLWAHYSQDDIVKIIRAVYEQCKNPPDGETYSDVLSKFRSADNLRDILANAPERSGNSIRVNVLNGKSSEDIVKKTMSAVGLLDDPNVIKTAQNILSKA